MEFHEIDESNADELPDPQPKSLTKEDLTELDSELDLRANEKEKINKKIVKSMFVKEIINFKGAKEGLGKIG